MDTNRIYAILFYAQRSFYKMEAVLFKLEMFHPQMFVQYNGVKVKHNNNKY